MIGPQLTQELQRLVAEREPFALATVVRARRPTSVRPGDAALVHRDGSIEGFVGGACAESSVRLHALRAMETGEALLLRLVPADTDEEGAEVPDGTAEVPEGAVLERNPCLSGGSLEIFLEPHLPAVSLVIVGDTPIACALQQLAQAAGYECRRGAAPDTAAVAGAAAVIVASHGNGEEDALIVALTAGVPYVALVASRRRGAAVRDALDVPEHLRAQLHTPAGLDIGARTPAEIAISILAELTARRHADPAGRPAGRAPAATSVAVDPMCGMNVAVSAAAPQLRCRGETVYFCGPACRDRYAEQHSDELVG